MKKKKSWVSAFSLVTQLGWSMLIPILGCTYVGIYLDNLTGKEPLWLVVFILLGVGSAFRNLFHIVLHEAKKGEYHDDE
ncbi:MAG: ATP synthase subunit [Epulopiscium sp. Nele67-Bin005]|nr:MAG: ATP synthase subunit [Epulopiscium sp. Nele67-Bin005]